MDITEKRKSTLINVAYFAVLAAGYYFFMKYALDIVAPFVFAFLVALVLQKPIRFISQKTKIPQKAVALGIVAALLAVFAGLVALVGYKLFVEFRDFGEFVAYKINDLPRTIESTRIWLLDVIEFLPNKLEASLAESINGFAKDIAAKTAEDGISGLGKIGGGITEKIDFSMLEGPIGGIVDVAKRIPWFLTAVLISIIACFFITADYDNVVGMIKRNVSEKNEYALVKAKNLFSNVLGKMVKSYTTIIFITFAEVAIGLNLLQLFDVYKGSHIIVISILTALLDILPVFGTGTVLIPWSICSFIMGDVPFAIGLIVLYVLITVIRQVIEPHLVAMNVGVHPTLTLAGMYVGIQLFGVIGLFALPITLVLLKALNQEGIIHLWGREKKNCEESQKNEEEKAETEQKNAEISK